MNYIKLPVYPTYLLLSTGTSRAKDSYGQRVVRLKQCGHPRSYAAVGGGYDLVGSALGKWLQAELQVCLRALPKSRIFTTYLDDKDTSYVNKNYMALYGTSRRHGVTSIDCACGLESVFKVFEAIGIDVEKVPDGKGSLLGFRINSKDKE